MPGHWVILRCTSHQAPIEIAMAESTVTGFSSWLEAGPPGAPGRMPDELLARYGLMWLDEPDPLVPREH